MIWRRRLIVTVVAAALSASFVAYHCMARIIGPTDSCPCLGASTTLAKMLPEGSVVLVAGILLGGCTFLSTSAVLRRPLVQREPNDPPRWGMVAALVGAFVILVAIFVPLRDAYTYGGDEGFELLKARHYLAGNIKEMWNDQPPLHTHLLALLMRITGDAPMAPRVLSLAASAVLLFAIAWLASNGRGGLGALLAVVILLLWKATMQLSVSAMLELPAWTFGVLALAMAANMSKVGVSHVVFAAASLAVGISMKFTAALLLPAILSSIWSNSSTRASQDRPTPVGFSPAKNVVLFMGALALFLCFMILAVPGWHFADMVASHASPYASVPSDEGLLYRFHVARSIRNLGVTGLAVVASLWWITEKGARDRRVTIGLVLFVTLFVVHSLHWPYWEIYDWHFAIPLSILGVVGAERLLARARELEGRAKDPAVGGRPWLIAGLTGLFVLACFDGLAPVRDMVLLTRYSPRIHANLAVRELEFWGQLGRRAYCFDPLLAYHAKLEVPPVLAVLPVKRFWSGHLEVEAVVRKLKQLSKPCDLLVIPPGDAAAGLWSEMITNKYVAVYDDAIHAIYVHRSHFEKLNRPRSLQLEEALGISSDKQR